MTAKDDPATHEISVEQAIEAPARLAFRCWAENTLLHPDQILKRTGMRMVRFTWTGTDAPGSVAEIDFQPKGANGCLVRVTHSQIADQTMARVLRQRWTDELEALAAFTLEKQQVPTLEMQVLDGPVPKPGDRGDN